jgi:hypothetical protein
VQRRRGGGGGGCIRIWFKHTQRGCGGGERGRGCWRMHFGHRFAHPPPSQAPPSRLLLACLGGTSQHCTGPCAGAPTQQQALRGCVVVEKGRCLCPVCLAGVYMLSSGGVYRRRRCVGVCVYGSSSSRTAPPAAAAQLQQEGQGCRQHTTGQASSSSSCCCAAAVSRCLLQWGWHLSATAASHRHGCVVTLLLVCVVLRNARGRLRVCGAGGARG